jgi:hypothetical protein
MDTRNNMDRYWSVVEAEKRKVALLHERMNESYVNLVNTSLLSRYVLADLSSSPGE